MSLKALVPCVAGIAMLVGVACAAMHVVGGEPPSGAALLANKCILCNAFGPSHVPRICTSCNNKYSSKCILCNAFGPSHVPRICTSCNNKF